MNAISESTGLAEAHDTVLQAIRYQHPDWVDEHGTCPNCDSYEQKLAELLVRFEPEEERAS